MTTPDLPAEAAMRAADAVDLAASAASLTYEAGLRDGAAAERERIRLLAVEVGAEYVDHDFTRMPHSFSDLLRQGGDTDDS